jgi:hypothetical protein
MNELLDNLRAFITEKASDPDFVHHKWFIKWHLELVETLSKDMMKYYPEADEMTLIVLSWMHDYGKIIDFQNQYDLKYADEGKQVLKNLGFDEKFAEMIGESVKLFDKKDHLENESIEIRIVSSADACSHLIGPWVSLYWYENPEKPFEDIMKENVRKMGGEWDLKVTIPEAIDAYKQLHDDVMFHAEGTLRHI